MEKYVFTAIGGALSALVFAAMGYGLGQDAGNTALNRCLQDRTVVIQQSDNGSWVHHRGAHHHE